MKRLPEATPLPCHSTAPAAPRAPWLLAPLVLLSGFCGISYEILYARMLANLLGSPFSVTATVLLTFLLGIGVGTLHAHRWRRHLWAIELGIGLYAILLATTYDGIDLAVQAVSSIAPSAATPMVAAFVLLATPALLIGCSIPIFAAMVASVRTDRVFSFAYGLYNLGAALTALALHFVVLRSFGLRATTLGLASLNLIVAAGIFMMDRSGSVRAVEPEPAPRASIGRRVMSALVLASMASAVFQLTMMKVFEAVYGPFNDTFAIVLAVTLIGITLGTLAVAHLELSFSGALTIAVTGVVLFLGLFPASAEVYASLFSAAAEQHGTLVTLKVGLAMALMVLPSIGFGATVPALLRRYSDVAVESGRVLACSSFANAAGFLCMALLLHPYLDYGQLLAVVIGVLLVALVLQRWRLRELAIAGGLASSAALIALPAWDEMLLYVSHSSFRSAETLASTKVDRERTQSFKGAQDTFAIVESGGSPRFFINGYVSIALDSIAEKAVGAVSAVFAPRLDDALVLGVGSGATAGTVGILFDQTDAVEINQVILDNLHRMQEHNFDILEQPSTHLVHGDGIRFVRTTEKRYSLILNTVTSPLYFSSSKLYTSDFFEHVEEKLTPDGIYVTWIDGKLDDEGLDVILRSIDSTFDHCWMAYLRSGYFLLICSTAPIAPRSAAEVVANDRLDTYLKEMHDVPARMLPYLALTPDAQQLRGSDQGLTNTMDFPALEHLMASNPGGGLVGLKERLGTELDLTELSGSMAPHFDWDPNEFALMMSLRLSESSSLWRPLQAALERHQGVHRSTYADAIVRWAEEVNSARGFARAARRLEDLEEYERAMAFLRRSLDLDPDRPRSHYRFGRCKSKLGLRAEALDHYLAEWRLHGYDMAALRACEALLEESRPDEAARLLGEAHPDQIGPSARRCYILGRIAEAQGLRAAARAQFQEALELNDDYDRARRALEELPSSAGGSSKSSGISR